MVNAVKTIVVGQWSQDSQLPPAHIRGDHSNVFIYSSTEVLHKGIATTFTFSGTSNSSSKTRGAAAPHTRITWHLS